MGVFGLVLRLESPLSAVSRPPAPFVSKHDEQFFSHYLFRICGTCYIKGPQVQNAWTLRPRVS